MCVRKCLGADPNWYLLVLIYSYKVNFDTEDDTGWFPYNFDDSVVSQVSAYRCENSRGAFTQVEWRYVAATRMSMLLREFDQTLHNWRWFDLGAEVSIYTWFPVSSISTPL